LFGELKERYADRKCGYTRLWNVGNRPGDNAPMAMIEYINSPKDLKVAFARKGFLIDDPAIASTYSPQKLKEAQEYKDKMLKALKEFESKNLK
jgi:hypothetical protein